MQQVVGKTNLSSNEEIEYKALRMLADNGYTKIKHKNLCKTKLHRLFKYYFEPSICLTDISTLLQKSGLKFMDIPKRVLLKPLYHKGILNGISTEGRETNSPQYGAVAPNLLYDNASRCELEMKAVQKGDFDPISEIKDKPNSHIPPTKVLLQTCKENNSATVAKDIQDFSQSKIQTSADINVLAEKMDILDNNNDTYIDEYNDLVIDECSENFYDGNTQSTDKDSDIHGINSINGTKDLSTHTDINSEDIVKSSDVISDEDNELDSLNNSNDFATDVHADDTNMVPLKITFVRSLKEDISNDKLIKNIEGENHQICENDKLETEIKQDYIQSCMQDLGEASLTDAVDNVTDKTYMECARTGNNLPENKNTIQVEDIKHNVCNSQKDINDVISENRRPSAVSKIYTPEINHKDDEQKTEHLKTPSHQHNTNIVKEDKLLIDVNYQSQLYGTRLVIKKDKIVLQNQTDICSEKPNTIDNNTQNICNIKKAGVKNYSTRKRKSKHSSLEDEIPKPKVTIVSSDDKTITQDTGEKSVPRKADAVYNFTNESPELGSPERLVRQFVHYNWTPQGNTDNSTATNGKDRKETTGGSKMKILLPKINNQSTTDIQNKPPLLQLIPVPNTSGDSMMPNFFPLGSQASNQIPVPVQLIPVVSIAGATYSQSGEKRDNKSKNNTPIQPLVKLPVFLNSILPKYNPVSSNQLLNNSNKPLNNSTKASLVYNDGQPNQRATAAIEKKLNQLNPRTIQPSKQSSNDDVIKPLTYSSDSSQLISQSQKAPNDAINTSPSIISSPNNDANIKGLLNTDSPSSRNHNSLTVGINLDSSATKPIVISPDTEKPTKKNITDNGLKIEPLHEKFDDEMFNLRKKFQEYSEILRRLGILEERKKKEQQQIQIKKEKTRLTLINIKKQYDNMKAIKISNHQSHEAVYIAKENQVQFELKLPISKEKSPPKMSQNTDEKQHDIITPNKIEGKLNLKELTKNEKTKTSNTIDFSENAQEIVENEETKTSNIIDFSENAHKIFHLSRKEDYKGTDTVKLDETNSITTKQDSQKEVPVKDGTGKNTKEESTEETVGHILDALIDEISTPQNEYENVKSNDSIDIIIGENKTEINAKPKRKFSEEVEEVHFVDDSSRENKEILVQSALENIVGPTKDSKYLKKSRRRRMHSYQKQQIRPLSPYRPRMHFPSFATNYMEFNRPPTMAPGGFYEQNSTNKLKVPTEGGQFIPRPARFPMQHPNNNYEQHRMQQVQIFPQGQFHVASQRPGFYPHRVVHPHQTNFPIRQRYRLGYNPATAAHQDQAHHHLPPQIIYKNITQPHHVVSTTHSPPIMAVANAGQNTIPNNLSPHQQAPQQHAHIVNTTHHTGNQSDIIVVENLHALNNAAATTHISRTLPQNIPIHLQGQTIPAPIQQLPQLGNTNRHANPTRMEFSPYNVPSNINSYEKVPTRVIEYRPMTGEQADGANQGIRVENQPQQQQMSTSQFQETIAPIAAIIRTTVPNQSKTFTVESSAASAMQHHTIIGSNPNDQIQNNPLPNIRKDPPAYTDLCDAKFIILPTKQMPSITKNSPAKELKTSTTLSGLYCSSCKREASFVCSGCKRTPYCSEACQNGHWQEHSKYCS